MANGKKKITLTINGRELFLMLSDMTTLIYYLRFIIDYFSNPKEESGFGWGGVRKCPWTESAGFCNLR
jgi:hypothetical protein